MKINHRHSILIFFAIISIFASSFAYYFIYNKTLELAHAYIRDIGDVNSEGDKNQKEQQLVKVYETTKDSRIKINSFLIHEEKIVDFIETVEMVGINSNTKTEISSINNGDGLVKAQITSSGSWSGVMTALHLIENLPFSVVVKNVRLETMNDLDKKGSAWELSLNIEAISIK
jgi:hypothetical protein